VLRYLVEEAYDSAVNPFEERKITLEIAEQREAKSAKRSFSSMSPIFLTRSFDFRF
jgi:hypothetical protein